MPKQKSKSSLNKRVKVRKSGQIKRGKAKTSHLFANKTTKNKRQSRKGANVSNADKKRYKDLI
ncbi:MAG: 50S ribosomal protein L35 [Candidatus Hepatoplasma scabrum]|nr:MAG: 50S ribosomal protein L35 [Candidatus Hepatoplasma sp.]